MKKIVAIGGGENGHMKLRKLIKKLLEYQIKTIQNCCL